MYVNKIYSQGSFRCRRVDQISVTCSTQRRHYLPHDATYSQGLISHKTTHWKISQVSKARVRCLYCSPIAVTFGLINEMPVLNSSFQKSITSKPDSCWPRKYEYRKNMFTIQWNTYNLKCFSKHSIVDGKYQSSLIGVAETNGYDGRGGIIVN